MAINTNASFKQLTNWLNENLTDKKRIKACCGEVKKVPETKGIYFWFMPNSVYNTLQISQITPVYQKTINRESYDLVYLGSAGVRNNSSGENKSNLRKRLEWHLCDNKGISALCSKNSPTMSTFRSTIGGIISNDLLDNNTQDKIDDLFCKCFFIFYVEYPGTFKEVKDEVNSDEATLIQVIRPIFNIDQNPNAKIQNHITNRIQQSKKQIILSSRNKWCSLKIKSVKSEFIKKATKVNATYLGASKEGCFEFKVLRTKRIANVAAGINNLPSGTFTIELFSENGNDVRTYINGVTRRTRRSISEYFNAPDTNNGNISRDQIVYDEMNSSNNTIEEITVRVCKVN